MRTFAREQASTPSPAHPAAPRQPAPGSPATPAGALAPWLIQAKRPAGAAGDPYEEEADRIAERVAGTPEAEAAAGEAGSGAPVRAKRLEGGGAARPLPPSLALALHASGRPLDERTRAGMESRFGHDFSSVRVHTGAAAHRAAASVAARAFTAGEDVVFADGEYAPHTPAGRGLVAHELTHVLQQRGGASPAVQRQADDKAGDKADQPQAGGAVRLVFYQEKEPAFAGQAAKIAANLGALKLPFGKCPTDAGVGAIPCSRAENVLVRAADYARCLRKPLEQVHVVGHVYAGSGPACLSGGMTEEAAKSYRPDAKVVVHDCVGVGRYKAGTASILKHLPGASVYAHATSAEAGGPLEFVKITSDPAGVNPEGIAKQVQSSVAEGIGFTQQGVKEWAAAHLAHAKTLAADSEEIKIMVSWLTLPAFASAETDVFADVVLADPKAPDRLRSAATKYKAGRSAAKPQGSPATP